MDVTLKRGGGLEAGGRNVFRVLSLSFLACFVSLPLLSSPAEMHFTGEAVEVTGLDLAPQARLHRDWQQILSVYTGTELPPDPASKPAVLGSYETTQTSIRFVPRFPWAAGVSYVARFSPAALAEVDSESGSDEPLILRFEIPRQPVQRTAVVEQVYPTINVLPMNLLKFYIHFSAPMSPGEAYQHLRLLDEAGNEVPDAFLIMEPELWDPQHKRFTLLFDPGRIKRGLAPHKQLGLPLMQGRSYRLDVGDGWKDARGNPLKEGFEKPFRVVGPDYRSPRPADWPLSTPASGTRDPLQIDLTEPLDHALLGRLLHLEDASGNTIPGRIEISRQETHWSFIPDQLWQAGSYRLRIGSWLEDLAGNNLRRPFDTDLRQHSEEEDTESEAVLSFEIP